MLGLFRNGIVWFPADRGGCIRGDQHPLAEVEIMNVRRATVEDGPIVIEYIGRMIGGSNRKETAAAEFAKYRKSSDYTIHLAELNVEPVGFGLVKHHAFDGSDNVEEIVFLLIDERHRRKGMASNMLKTIEAEQRKRSTRKSYVKVNTANIQATCFWINQGYEFEVRLLQLNQSTDYYLMEKQL